MKDLNSFYRGIIIQNNDPLKLGRVKVFVPHLHLSLLDIDKKDYDKEFYFSEFGKNYNQSSPNLIDMTKYVEKIKPKLPWAEVSLPVTGGGFSSYNASSNNATISDGASENGAPPGALFQSSPPKDKFPQNVSGGSYIAQAYYNSPKGLYGIPEVNTKVWLFFIAGNPNNPVVFGFSPSPRTYAEIYDATSYPSSYENNAEVGDRVRRNKIAMNYRGGSLTIDGTTNKEEVSLAHDSGSFSKFNNSGKSDLIVGENQILVKGNGYLTVEGKQYCYYEEGIETTIGSSGFGSIQNFGGGGLGALASGGLASLASGGLGALASGGLASLASGGLGSLASGGLGSLVSGGLGSLASGGLGSLVSGGLGSLASGAFGSSLGSINNILESATSTLNNTIGSVTGSLNNALGSVTTSLNSTLNSALGSVTSTLNTTLNNALGSVSGSLNKALGPLTTSLNTTLNNTLGSVNQSLNNVLSPLTSSLDNTLNSVTSNLNNTLGSLTSNLESLVPNNIDISESINKGLSKLNPISLNFSDIPNNVDKKANDYVGKIFKSLEDGKFYKIIS